MAKNKADQLGGPWLPMSTSSSGPTPESEPSQTDSPGWTDRVLTVLVMDY